MQERRRNLFWKTKYTLPFFGVTILCILIFIFLGFASFLYMVSKIKDAFQIHMAWMMYFVWFVVILSAAILTLFTCMSILLYRTVGPIPRIEKILDKVISGDYSQRIYIRKKDSINSLVGRLNQIIALLDKRGEGLPPR
jgi:signal transduction histidine kinase